MRGASEDAQTMKRITSRHNQVVARFRSVARGAEPGILLDGAHLVNEALPSIRIRLAMVATKAMGRDDIADLASRLERNGVEVCIVSEPVMAAVSQVASSSAIVAVGDRPENACARIYAGVPLVAIACDVQDPGNLGAIVRAFEAAGGSGVVAAGRSADPFGPKALRGSMGSALRLPLGAGDPFEAVAQARRHNCRVFAAVPRGGHSLFDVDLTGPLAVLIGSEGDGLSPDLVACADQRLTIPMQPQVESLNAAITAALVVYEARRQRTGTRSSRRTRGAGP
jgi:TrmH family RNA methyltransferase